MKQDAASKRIVQSARDPNQGMPRRNAQILSNLGGCRIGKRKKARRDVETLIQQFADSGCTLVFASHNLGQAKRLATRVVYLEQSKLLVDLPTKDFFNKELPNEAALFLQGERV